MSKYVIKLVYGLLLLSLWEFNYASSPKFKYTTKNGGGANHSFIISNTGTSSIHVKTFSNRNATLNNYVDTTISAGGTYTVSWRDNGVRADANYVVVGINPTDSGYDSKYTVLIGMDYYYQGNNSWYNMLFYGYANSTSIQGGTYPDWIDISPPDNYLCHSSVMNSYSTMMSMSQNGNNYPGNICYVSDGWAVNVKIPAKVVLKAFTFGDEPKPNSVQSSPYSFNMRGKGQANYTVGYRLENADRKVIAVGETQIGADNNWSVPIITLTDASNYTFYATEYNKPQNQGGVVASPQQTRTFSIKQTHYFIIHNDALSPYAVSINPQVVYGQHCATFASSTTNQLAPGYSTTITWDDNKDGGCLSSPYEYQAVYIGGPSGSGIGQIVGMNTYKDQKGLFYASSITGAFAGTDGVSPAWITTSCPSDISANSCISPFSYIRGADQARSANEDGWVFNLKIALKAFTFGDEPKPNSVQSSPYSFNMRGKGQANYTVGYRLENADRKVIAAGETKIGADNNWSVPIITLTDASNYTFYATEYNKPQNQGGVVASPQQTRTFSIAKAPDTVNIISINGHKIDAEVVSGAKVDNVISPVTLKGTKNSGTVLNYSIDNGKSSTINNTSSDWLIESINLNHGRHTISITQSLNGQTSKAITLYLEVVAPVDIIVPAESSSVLSHDRYMIKCTGEPGATVLLSISNGWYPIDKVKVGADGMCPLVKGPSSGPGKYSLSAEEMMADVDVKTGKARDNDPLEEINTEENIVNVISDGSDDSE